MPRFTFYAFGDSKITAQHPTTLEITKERVRSEKGDCIIACGASVGLRGLPEELKKALRGEGTRARLVIEAGGISEEVEGRGDPRLTFKSESEMVVRKSDFVCGRTLFIKANKSAAELSRDLVKALAEEGRSVRITIEVK
ncbi:MAG: DUF371 domain-containing protein [Candidatus Verstraetearchaeota archaeon]|nr:DUF371 domain-containing protein [Candidatus Verstraetearchaeota archaeon]